MRARIPTFSPCFGDLEKQVMHLNIARNEFITSGKGVVQCEKNFARYLGMPYSVMVNSGSSALFVAMWAMGWNTSDKIIIPACNFPSSTSVAIWTRLTPVFVDCDLGTYNTSAEILDACLRKVPDIKGAILLHNLGNPLNADVWSMFDRSVEDASDALGSEIDGRPCGTFGLVSTHSFYPAHGITTGEGGMVVTRHHGLEKKMRSIVSWGRDCVCHPGEESRCKNRFGFDVDGVPYDHRYITAEAGGNFKVLDLQGDLGSYQITKAKTFAQNKRRNFGIIYSYLSDLEDDIILPKSIGDPAWFGFAVTLKKDNRQRITRRLEEKGIQTRMIFAGNVTRHPFIKPHPYIIPFDLKNSDTIMSNAFQVGCGQSVTEEEAHYIGKTIADTIKEG